MIFNGKVLKIHFECQFFNRLAIKKIGWIQKDKITQNILIWLMNKRCISTVFQNNKSHDKTTSTNILKK